MAASTAQYYGTQDINQKVVLPTDVKVNPDHILIQKINPEAEWPKKEDPTSPCHEIHLISRTDGRSEDDLQKVNGFHTGFRVCPPLGYHVEFFATDSLIRQGYMLACGVKILDPNDRDEVVFDLFKFKEGPDLELPFNAVKMRLVKTEYSNIRSADVIRPSNGTLRAKKPQSYQPQFEEEDTVPVVKSRGKKAAASHFY